MVDNEINTTSNKAQSQPLIFPISAPNSETMLAINIFNESEISSSPLKDVGVILQETHHVDQLILGTINTVGGVAQLAQTLESQTKFLGAFAHIFNALDLLPLCYQFLQNVKTTIQSGSYHAWHYLTDHLFENFTLSLSIGSSAISLYNICQLKTLETGLATLTSQFLLGPLYMALVYVIITANLLNNFYQLYCTKQMIRLFQESLSIKTNQPEDLLHVILEKLGEKHICLLKKDESSEKTVIHIEPLGKNDYLNMRSFFDKEHNAQMEKIFTQQGWRALKNALEQTAQLDGPNQNEARALIVGYLQQTLAALQAHKDSLIIETVGLGTILAGLIGATFTPILITWFSIIAVGSFILLIRSYLAYGAHLKSLCQSDLEKEGIELNNFASQLHKDRQIIEQMIDQFITHSHGLTVLSTDTMDAKEQLLWSSNALMRTFNQLEPHLLHQISEKYGITVKKMNAKKLKRKIENDLKDETLDANKKTQLQSLLNQVTILNELTFSEYVSKITAIVANANMRPLDRPSSSYTPVERFS